MSLQQENDQLNPRYAECMRLAHCWLWFIVLGVLLMIVGVAAIGSTFITTIASILFFGILLMCAGVVEIVNAFLARSWEGFFIHLLVGILYLLLGMLMSERPLDLATVFTLMLALAFLVGGAMRFLYGIFKSFEGRWWVVLNGLVSFMLGLAIWRRWPESSLWVIGLFIGIDIFLNGWSWVMLGLAIKRYAPKSSQQSAPSSAMPAAQ